MSFGFFVRTLYFFAWLWPGTPETAVELDKKEAAKNPGMAVGLRVFFITFPQL